MSSPTEHIAEQVSASNPISQPTQPTFSPDTALIALNITTQINEKLKPSTFPQWRAQFEALLIGYNLLDYVQGLSQCPSPVGTSITDLNKTHWVRQDKLILSAILASTSSTITPLIASAKTSHEAWEKLHHMYASKSRTRAMQLKEELTLIQRKNRSVPDYLHAVKALADEIALIDHPISDDDLTLYILNGLGSDFRDIATTIRARPTSLAFEELHDILVGHDNYLRHLDSSTQQLLATANYSHRHRSSTYNSSGSARRQTYRQNGPTYKTGPLPEHTYTANRPTGPFKTQRQYPQPTPRRFSPKCQFCDQMGHTAKTCSQLRQNSMTANCANTNNAQDQKWLLDSAASHNITGDLANLSMHSEYDGTDEVVIGDGTGPSFEGDFAKRCM